MKIYKARLVAKGYNQKHEIDSFETFSPVAKMNIVQPILALASIYQWLIFLMDVYNAFLQGDFNEEVYMHTP